MRPWRMHWPPWAKRHECRLAAPAQTDPDHIDMLDGAFVVVDATGIRTQTPSAAWTA